MTDEMMFSVVVPTYNRRDLLRATVESIGATRRPWPCELIVVDDGSTDGTSELAGELHSPLDLRWVRQANAGAAAARNHGARLATGRYLLFLDDDMVADERLLVEHARTLEAGADAVVGHIPLHPDTPRTVLTRGVDRWARRRHERLVREGGRLSVADFLTGQLSVRRSRFVQISGFDEDRTAGGSFGGEDTDLLFRLRRAGLRLAYNGAAVSFQRYIVTPEQNLRQWREAGRSDAALSRLHPGIGRTLWHQHRGGTVTGRSARAAARLPERALRPLRTVVLRRAAAGRLDPGTEWSFARMRDVAYWAGARDGGGLDRGGPPGVRVLAYHAIDRLDDPVIGRWTVTPAMFERQMTTLVDRGFTFVDTERFLGHVETGAPLPERSLLLTFDDGYRSLLDSAAPVLAKLGIPAVVCVVTGQLGGHNAWDAASGATALPLLTAAQLKTLGEAGWEIAAHTHTHAHLTSLSGARLREELTRPRDTLAALGLRPPRVLAYPHGEHDFRVRAHARRAGYRAALALRGPERSGPATTRFALPRVEVFADTTAERLCDLLTNPELPAAPELSRELKAAVRLALDGVPRQRHAPHDTVVT